MKTVWKWAWPMAAIAPLVILAGIIASAARSGDWGWLHAVCGLCLLGAAVMAATGGLVGAESQSQADHDAAIDRGIVSAVTGQRDCNTEVVYAMPPAVTAYRGERETEELLRELLESVGYEVDLMTIGRWSNDEFDSAYIWGLSEFRRRSNADDPTTMVLAPPCVVRGRVVH
jgi:hypothetical protein